ncbi:AbrB/MazE/SpoVT family DNA-binding domain-containing protein [Halobacteriales archaeon Cl-PHB]
MRYTGRLINSGKVTIPSHIRDALGVEDGDYVEISIETVDTGGLGNE